MEFHGNPSNFQAGPWTHAARMTKTVSLHRQIHLQLLILSFTLEFSVFLFDEFDFWKGKRSLHIFLKVLFTGSFHGLQQFLSKTCENLPDKSDPAWGVPVITQLDVCEMRWTRCCRGNEGREREVRQDWVWRSWHCQVSDQACSRWPLMRSEPLEILSAVAVHSCLLFLISGGGRGGGRGCRRFFGVMFPPL